jgi:hypothetical protein
LFVQEIESIDEPAPCCYWIKAGEKGSGKAVAKEVGMHPGTVSKIVQRYMAGGVAGAMEEKPRPGHRVKIAMVVINLPNH